MDHYELGKVTTVRILVTGSAGFIGSSVVAVLREAGHEVSGLDCFLPAAHRQPPPVAEGMRHGDVRDPDTVRESLRGVDAVCHQAAMVGMGVSMADAPGYASCNDLGTAVLLAGMAAAGVGKLVLASSMVVYGEGAYDCEADGPQRPLPRTDEDLRHGRFEPRCPQCLGELAPSFVDETAPLDPRSLYAASKAAQEHFASAWARATGGCAIALRYHNVYGPNMPRDTPYAGVAAIFRSALENGEPARVFEDGGQRRDFIHVRDIARANLLALQAGGAPGSLTAYNIATGQPHTILDLANELTAATAGPAPEVTGAFRGGDVRHVTASPARARDELRFAAEIPFAQGIKDFAAAPLRG